MLTLCTMLLICLAHTVFEIVTQQADVANANISATLLSPVTVLLHLAAFKFTNTGGHGPALQRSCSPIFPCPLTITFCVGLTFFSSKTLRKTI
jgi:hypothetical protein